MQRHVSGGGGGGGAGGFLRRFDIYRKVPRDLTEATALGGSISLVFYALFLVLFMAEVRNFLAVSERTEIEIDHAEDGILQVNVNVTFSKVSCEWLAVDVVNVLHQKREDIKDRTLHKYDANDGQHMGYANEAVDDRADLEHLYEMSGKDRDHYGNTRHAIEISESSKNGATLSEMLDRFEVVLVDFHAPWCIHCQRLSPIYEHAADLVKQRGPVEIDRHHKHAVALATFDCTIPEHRATCLKEGIQAFPTILVYRQSSKHMVTGAMGRYYEMYTGKREAKPIADFALSVLKDVQSKDVDALPMPHKGHDADKDGTPDSKVQAHGCRVEGYLMVRRVPASIIMRLSGDRTGHSVAHELLRLDHRISHLSFGNRKPSEVRQQVPDNMEGAYAEKPGRPVVLAEGIDEVGFSSLEDNRSNGTVFEHFMKVVGTSRIPASASKKKPILTAYEYSFSSSTHSGEEPKVVFSYDISPMRIVVREETKPWIEGAVALMALLGGVYSFSMIFEGLVSGAASLAKKRD